MLHAIPSRRPSTPLLDQVRDPADLRRLAPDELPRLCRELREFMLYSVGQTGGHLGAGLGVVELTVALHRVFQTPADALIWDVGHQCYPHKILTGRREQMLSMRRKGGLSPFPKRSESPYDSFGTGHSSTSISAALGMALANHLQQNEKRVVAIIGDGAMTGGMAFEALNHAAHTDCDLLVILNDNDMSISPNEGGLATYLSKNLRNRTEATTTAALFEALEFTYTGPVDGHNLTTLVSELERLRHAKGPQFLHLRTQKGRGFSAAENDPVGFHAISKLPAPEEQTGRKPQTYANVFGHWLCDMAERDPRLVGITPAMREGSDLVAFSQRFPERYFDVAIAEQHAVTFAGGLACQGLKPVVAIYSTFLQRGYDQLIHDVAVQDLDVLFAVDRAGLVGEDGPTHSGSFDLSYLRCIPGLVLMTPANEAETRLLLNTGYFYPGPAAVRYPRGCGPGLPAGDSLDTVEIGRSRPVRHQQGQQGPRVALLNFGNLLHEAQTVAESLDLSLVDMRFVKPLDQHCLQALAASQDLLVTLEENTLQGGAGSAVNDYLLAQGLAVPVLNLGLPDQFVEHGAPGELRALYGLDATGIEAAIRRRLAGMGY